MMKAIIFAAAALLILQIGLTVAVHQQQTTNLESTAPDSAFLSFTPDAVTSLVISGFEDEEAVELVLEKKDKGWIMPGAFSAPANTNQVDELLRKLADARQGLAVATSKGAAERFKTAEDEFERHIVLKQGDSVVADVYLGTSAGFRNSHARLADQKAVVSIPVGGHEADTDADSWLDRTLAELDKDDLKTVTLGDISLTKQEKKKTEDGENKPETSWLLDGATAEETAKDEVDKLLNKITGISVQSVLDPATSAALFEKDPAVQFTVTRQDDSEVSYAFAKQEEDYVLKMSDNELYFKVGKWQVDDLTEMKRDKLLVGYEEKADEPPVAVAQEAPLPLTDTPEQAAVPAPAQEAAPEQVELPDIPVDPAEEEVFVPAEAEADAVQTSGQTSEPAEQQAVQEPVSEHAVEQEQAPAETATESAAGDTPVQEMPEASDASDTETPATQQSSGDAAVDDTAEQTVPPEEAASE